MKAEIFTVFSEIFSVVCSVAQDNKVCKNNYDQYIVVMIHERGWKDAVIANSLIFFEMVSDKSFAKMYEDNTFGSVRGRDNASNICLNGSKVHCLCHVSPVTLCGYCLVLICCQSANFLPSFRLTQFYFITFQGKV